MRLTGSGVYSRPAGVPKMPPGLVELMEGLTKDVLKHNPANVYEFCANHMRTLLEIRDGRAPDRLLTLEKKILRAQQKVRQKAEERYKKYDMEMKLLSIEGGHINDQKVENHEETTMDNNIQLPAQNKTDEENTLEVDKIEIPLETQTENTLKAPIHHEKELADALEVEIFHKAADVVQNLNNDVDTEQNEQRDIVEKDESVADETNKLKGNIHDDTKSETSHDESKCSDIHLNFHENDGLVENDSGNTLENVSDTTDVTDNNKSNMEDDMVGNDIDKSPDHIRKSRSIDSVDETFDTVDVEQQKNDIVDTKNDKDLTTKNGGVEDLSTEKTDTNISDTSHEKTGDVDLEEVVEEKVNHVVDVANDMSDVTMKTTEETIDSIGDTMKEIAENAKTIEKNENNVEEAIGVESSEDAIKDLKHITEENLESMNAALEEVGENSEKGEKIANMADKTKEHLSVLCEGNLEIVDIVNEKIGESVKENEAIIEDVHVSNAKIEDIVNSENMIDTLVDTTISTGDEGFKDNNLVNVLEETVGDVLKVVENVDATEVNNISEVFEEKVEDIVNDASSEIDGNLEESEIQKDSLDVPIEISDETTKATEDSSTEMASGETVTITKITSKDVPIEISDETAKATEDSSTEMASGETVTMTKITSKDEENGPEKNIDTEDTINKNTDQSAVLVDKVDKDDKHGVTAFETTDTAIVNDSGPDNIVSNNDNGSTDKDSTIENDLLVGDHTNSHDKDKSFTQENNSADKTTPMEIKETDVITSDVTENVHSNVITENINDPKNGDILKVSESENMIKEDILDANHDKDRDTLLESPTLENIKSVIKSEISVEEVPNNETTELVRFKRDLENISEAQEISESVHPDTETLSIKKSNSMDSTISNSNDSILELDTVKSSDESTQGTTQNHSNMDLETAAVTIQKVFRTFMFKSRGSTFDDTGNDDNNLTDEDNEKEEADFKAPTTAMNKERRTLGISRMDTVLQTVNEEKSLSLSTDDSSTLSSAATVIQAHVRGFLVRNRLNSNKTASSNSLVNSDAPSTTSLEADNDQQKANKTVLNIHIVPGDNYLSRDESMITSMDLSLDGSPPSSTNLHPLGYDKSEPRKQLKREDAIQSVSPPSNNSGKLSEDVDSMKEVLNNDVSSEQNAKESTLINELQHAAHADDRRSPTLTKSTTIETAVETQKYTSDDSGSPEPEKELSELKEKRKRTLTKMSSDESDVVTPFLSEDKGVSHDSGKASGLLHSGEFHDVVLPTKVSRSDTSVVREFKNVLVYFLLLNNS